MRTQQRILIDLIKHRRTSKWTDAAFIHESQESKLAVFFVWKGESSLSALYVQEGRYTGVLPCPVYQQLFQKMQLAAFMCLREGTCYPSLPLVCCFYMISNVNKKQDLVVLI